MAAVVFTPVKVTQDTDKPEYFLFASDYLIPEDRLVARNLSAEEREYLSLPPSERPLAMRPRRSC